MRRIIGHIKLWWKWRVLRGQPIPRWDMDDVDPYPTAQSKLYAILTHGGAK